MTRHSQAHSLSPTIVTPRDIAGRTVHVATNTIDGTITVPSQELIDLIVAMTSGEWTEDGFDLTTPGGDAADLLYDGARIMARILQVDVR